MVLEHSALHDQEALNGDQLILESCLSVLGIRGTSLVFGFSNGFVASPEVGVLGNSVKSGCDMSKLWGRNVSLAQAQILPRVHDQHVRYTTPR